MTARADIEATMRKLAILCAALGTWTLAAPALADRSIGPMAAVLHRGRGRADVGLGLDAATTTAPLEWLHVGLRGQAIGTGFMARSPGVIVGADGILLARSGRYGIGASAGIDFVSLRVCGQSFCGRQIGVVPSAGIRLTYALSNSVEAAFGGHVLYAVDATALPALNGFVSFGVVWSIKQRGAK